MNDSVLFPRLNAATPIVWRSATELQLGLDEHAIVLCGVPRRLEAVIRRLDGQHGVSDLERLLPGDWVGWVVATLGQAGLLASPLEQVPPVVRVLGLGRLGLGVAAGLVGAGVRVRLAEPQPIETKRFRRLTGTLTGWPLPRPVLEREADLSAATVTLTVVASDTAEPDRALTDRLMAAEAPHLVVRHQPGRAVVGPLVVPGETGCLRCSDLATSGCDDQWPLVAYGLSRVRATAEPVLTAWATAVAVAHAVAYAGGLRPETCDGTVEMAADAVTRFRQQGRHPDCSCQMMGGGIQMAA